MQYQLLCVLFSFSWVGVRHDTRSNFMGASMEKKGWESLSYIVKCQWQGNESEYGVVVE